ncbi:hypothetical protein ADIAL_1397 [Alkalibacterium sp. AK22]|uniref:hypothetical protein n=1 Tax=Alkalibacterium sp. AK22 TaxID=1229520 RepID=UPI00044D9E96|nr:hypothetical protein [Alkalibacterium sp. AK22]EXJ23250.1 hypothetical protein ADIAL_1397 [Alkalibacterium sp. AK22]
MKKDLSLFLLSLIFLFSCADFDRDPTAVTNDGSIETLADDEENRMQLPDLTDQSDRKAISPVQPNLSPSLYSDSILQELDQEPGRINWDKVHLTPTQFADLVYAYQNLTISHYLDLEAVSLYIAHVDYSAEQITVVISSDGRYVSLREQTAFAEEVAFYYQHLHMNSDLSTNSRGLRLLFTDEDEHIILDRQSF